MNKIYIRGNEIATKEYVDSLSTNGGNTDLTNYYTKEEIDGKGFVPTFKWNGYSSEDDASNIELFNSFYEKFMEYNGRVHLMAMTPNSQNPTYMVLDIQYDSYRGDETFYFSSIPNWSSSMEWDSEEYYFYQYTGYASFENGKCVEVSELGDYEAEIDFLSTTRQYDSGDYYSPISDGSPVSKGYMVEILKEGKYSISPDQLEKEFQNLITESIITIDEEDPTEIEFVRYEGETDGEYEFIYEDKWWGDGYRSTNGAHDNSYALGKFILNNPGDKTVRVSIDYDLTCATGDTAVFSELDTELAANSWNDYTNAYKVITGETYTYGSIAYDLTPGEHFITFKYMVGWKDEGEGEGDSLMVSFGWTNGAVQEHQLATEQFVKDYVAINGGGSGEGVDLSNYYTKNETNTAITNATENLMDETEVRNMVEMYLSTLNTKGYAPITSNVDMGTLPSGIYMNTSGNWLDVKIAKAGKTTLSVKPGGYLFWSNALLDVTASAYSFAWTINWDGVSAGILESARIQPSSDNTSHVYATGITIDLGKIATEEYVNNAVENIPTPDLTNYYTKSETDSAVSTIINNATQKGVQAYFTMPEQNSENASKVYQYLGTTNSQFTKGHFYFLEENVDISPSEGEIYSYNWIELETQNPTDLSKYSTTTQMNEAISNAVNGIETGSLPSIGDTLNMSTLEDGLYTWEGNKINTGSSTISAQMVNSPTTVLIENGKTYFHTNTGDLFVLDKATMNIKQINYMSDTLVYESTLDDYYTKTEINNMIGNINSLLDIINGEEV